MKYFKLVNTPERLCYKGYKDRLKKVRLKCERTEWSLQGFTEVGGAL